MGEPDDLYKLLGKLDSDIEHLQAQVAGINAKLDSGYVTRVEFEPIKHLVYGLVGLILTGVVGALVAMVIRQ